MDASWRRDRLYRAAVLLCAGTLTFGGYFAFDSVGSIGAALIAALGISRASLGLLYSCYSAAAIVSVLAGGALVDRIGTRAASLLFSGLVTLGAVLVALAPNLSVMCVGRLLLGAGTESLVVAQNAILARWFSGRRLALAFGMVLSITHVGTLLSFNWSSLLADRLGFRLALGFAAALCVASLGVNLLYVLLDRRVSRGLDLPPEEPASGPAPRLLLRDLSSFPCRFWVVTLLCVTFYSAYFPFVALSTDFFHTKWGLPQSAPSHAGLPRALWNNLRHLFYTAPGTTSIITLSSLVLAPMAGALGGRLRRRTTLMIAGSALAVPAFLCLGLTRLPPGLPMFVLGLSFVLLPTALWPMIPTLVRRERVGTAYGLVTMVQNLGLALFPWVNGKLRDLTHDYTASMLMFALLASVGLLLSLYLRRLESRDLAVASVVASVVAPAAGA